MDRFHDFFRDRLELIEQQITAACARAGRKRSAVQLVGVTKYVAPEVAAALHRAGLTHLGESRPQELWRKAETLPTTVQWHLIGHLQTNKIERTLPCVQFIHSVDSLKLLLAIEKEAARQKRFVSVLLEVNASREPAKHGFAPEEVAGVIKQLFDLNHAHVCGLMCMAALEDDPERARPTFAEVRQLRDRLKGQLPLPHTLDHLSMGMSHDFPVAIEEGATLIRVGSSLFDGLPEDARD